jgi:hypothetical protein
MSQLKKELSFPIETVFMNVSNPALDEFRQPSSARICDGLHQLHECHL